MAQIASRQIVVVQQYSSTTDCVQDAVSDKADSKVSTKFGRCMQPKLSDKMTVLHYNWIHSYTYLTDISADVVDITMVIIRFIKTRIKLKLN